MVILSIKPTIGFSFLKCVAFFKISLCYVEIITCKIGAEFARSGHGSDEYGRITASRQPS